MKLVMITDKSKLLNTAIEQTTKKLEQEKGEARAAELALQMKKIDENQYKAIQQNVQNPLAKSYNYFYVLNRKRCEKP